MRGRHPFAFLVGLLLCGCDETVIDCTDNAQWCNDFTLMPLGTVNRTDASTKLAVRFATQNATPSHETNFRVSVEQMPSGMVAMGAGTGLASPSSLDSGWDVALANPLPDLKAMQCGPAKLYLHARLRSKPKQTMLVPSSDPTSANYQQHGVADFTIVDERPSPFQGKGQMTGGSALSNLGLHTSGSQSSIYATLDAVPLRTSTQLGVGLLAQQSNAIGSVTLANSFQFVGEAAPARLLLKQVAGPPPCSGASVVLTACTQLATASDTADVANKCFSASSPFSWCFPSKSAAADGQGSYVSTIDAGGNLQVYNVTINTVGKSLIFTEWTTGQYTGYRHVTVGDVDGNDAMDVLALRQGAQPLLLLREGQNFNQTKQALATQLAARLANNAEASAGDAVATIGSFDHCDRRPDVLLASGGAVYALIQQADQSFVKKKLSLDQLPASAEITALLLADTDANGAADLLLVAVKPDTVYVYQVQ